MMVLSAKYVLVLYMDKIKNIVNFFDKIYYIKNNCKANSEEEDNENKIEKVLCQHCGRTEENGIR